MYKVLKLNSISKMVNEVLTDGYELTNECDNPHLVLVRSAQMAEYAVGNQLLAVARAGAGVNNIPFADYIKRGVVVFNTPGANANAVKELVLSALLLSCRKIYEGISWAQSYTGGEVKKAVEKEKARFVGREILGKTLGVVGLGAIGRLVADSAAALGMNILGYDPFLSKDIKLNSAVTVVDSLDQVYAGSDFITLHIPYSAETKGFINSDTIAKMKDGVALINLARGELVDNPSVLAAISAGKVSKYFTDFPTEELLNVENVIPCPHLGASTPEAEDNCAVMAAKQLKDFVENGNIVNSVNFPALKAERKGYRVTVLCDAQQETVAWVNKAFSKAGVTPLQFLSAVRGEAGYVIIDTAEKAPDSLIKELETIEGVYRVRVI